MKSRRLTSVVMSFLIIFSAMAVMNFTSINVQADPPQVWDTDAERIIQNETRYRENLTITVQNGDLIIKNNGILILNNSVTLEIECSVAGEYGIIIEEGGQFIINSSSANTKIISDPTAEGNTYPFLNSGTIDFL